MSHAHHKPLARLVSLGAAGLAALATRALLEQSWEKATGDEPPANPYDRDTPWNQAVMWTLSSAALGAVAGLVVRRWVAEAWVRSGHDR